MCCRPYFAYKRANHNNHPNISHKIDLTLNVFCVRPQIGAELRQRGRGQPWPEPQQLRVSAAPAPPSPPHRRTPHREKTNHAINMTFHCAVRSVLIKRFMTSLQALALVATDMVYNQVFLTVSCHRLYKVTNNYRALLYGLDVTRKY
jgi:hypothetical protein